MSIRIIYQTPPSLQAFMAYQSGKSQADAGAEAAESANRAQNRTNAYSAGGQAIAAGVRGGIGAATAKPAVPTKTINVPSAPKMVTEAVGPDAPPLGVDVGSMIPYSRTDVKTYSGATGATGSFNVQDSGRRNQIIQQKEVPNTVTKEDRFRQGMLASGVMSPAWNQMQARDRAFQQQMYAGDKRSNQMMDRMAEGASYSQTGHSIAQNKARGADIRSTLSQPLTDTPSGGGSPSGTQASVGSRTPPVVQQAMQQYRDFDSSVITPNMTDQEIGQMYYSQMRSNDAMAEYKGKQIIRYRQKQKAEAIDAYNRGELILDPKIDAEMKRKRAAIGAHPVAGTASRAMDRWRDELGNKLLSSGRRKPPPPGEVMERQLRSIDGIGRVQVVTDANGNRKFEVLKPNENRSVTNFINGEMEAFQKAGITMPDDYFEKVMWRANRMTVLSRGERDPGPYPDGVGTFGGPPAALDIFKDTFSDETAMKIMDKVIESAPLTVDGSDPGYNRRLQRYAEGVQRLKSGDWQNIPGNIKTPETRSAMTPTKMQPYQAALVRGFFQFQKDKDKDKLMALLTEMVERGVTDEKGKGFHTGFGGATGSIDQADADQISRMIEQQSKGDDMDPRLKKALKLFDVNKRAEAGMATVRIAEPDHATEEGRLWQRELKIIITRHGSPSKVKDAGGEDYARMVELEGLLGY